MTTYLSEKRIKELKNYLNSVLDKKTRARLLQIKLRTGLELYYHKKENIRMYWDYANNEVRNLNNQTSVNFNSELNKGNFNGAGDILIAYYNSKYPLEYDFVQNFNPTEIENKLNGVCGLLWSQNVDRLDMKDVIECQNIDDIIDERYNKKSVDPELLKKTEAVKKMADNFYKDIEYNSVEYWIYKNAVDEYIQCKDEQVLHNLLQKKN